MNEVKIENTVTDQMKPWQCKKCGRYHHKAFPEDGCEECSGAAISKRLGLDREPATTKTPEPSTLASATGSPFFVFDVESIGLHGEGFAVAGGVYINGAAQSEFCFCCPLDKAEGLRADRDWVERNVPVMEITHRDTYGLRLAFWMVWEKAKADGAEMAAECLWPVEARFLQDCIRDDAQRLPTAPYPCHEIASVMLSAGMNPMATYDRTPSELPRHNPLADARQSARLLSEALARMGNGPDERHAE